MLRSTIIPASVDGTWDDDTGGSNIGIDWACVEHEVREGTVGKPLSSAKGVDDCAK